MRKKYLFIAVLFSSLLYSQYYPDVSKKRESAQNELETLGKLYSLKKNDEKNSLSAKQKIFQYRNDVRNEIRQNIPSLSKENYEDLLDKENMYWQLVTCNLKNYSQNYDKFYRDYFEILEQYKNTMLDEIYKTLSKK